MAASTQLGTTIWELKQQIERQKAVVQNLEPLLRQYAVDICKSDQTALLDCLKSRVLQEVEESHYEEAVALNRFNRQKNISALTGFAAGMVFTAITHKSDPLSAGYNALNAALNKQASFDTILVAIDNEGMPDGVSVKSLSALARSSKTGENEIAYAIQEKGTVLVTPQVFYKLIANIKLRIMDGSLSLPIGKEQIASEIEAITQI